MLVGPDGVGKTTLARALVELYEGPTGYFHFRPPVFADLMGEPTPEVSPAVDKSPPRGFKPVGWLRLGKHVAQCWIGHLVSIRPALKKGALVIGDRWSYGYLVQPLAHRYYGPAWLAYLALRLLPRPDMVVNLTGSVEEIRHRKQELSEDAIRNELNLWPTLKIPGLVSLSGDNEPHEIARAVLEKLA